MPPYGLDRDRGGGQDVPADQEVGLAKFGDLDEGYTRDGVGFLGPTRGAHTEFEMRGVGVGVKESQDGRDALLPSQSQGQS